MSKRRISKSAGWANQAKLPKGPNGRSLCRWCSVEVPKGRRTFCSDDCVHQHKLRSSPQYLRRCVFDRDHGVCSECGRDTVAIEKQLQQRLRQQIAALSPDMRRAYLSNALIRSCMASGAANGRYADVYRDSVDQLGLPLGKRRYRGFWDADHIVPVVEGGGECDLDNIRTLCLLCHRVVTLELQLRLQAVKEQETKMAKKQAEDEIAAMKRKFRKFVDDDKNAIPKLVNATKVRKLADALDLRTSDDLHGFVVKALLEILLKGAQRCLNNNRQTIIPGDL